MKTSADVAGPAFVSVVWVISRQPAAGRGAVVMTLDNPTHAGPPAGPAHCP